MELREVGLLKAVLAGVTAFNGLNGSRLTMTNDEAYDLVMVRAVPGCQAE